MENRRKIKKEKSLDVRITDAEKRTFEAAAELSGLSVASWARARLRRAAIRELEEAGQTIPLFTEKEADA